MAYIPRKIFDSIGLAGTYDFDEIINKVLPRQYAVLRKMGKELAAKDSLYKLADEFASDVDIQHYSSSFTAAVIVLKAGFSVPKFNAISKKLKGSVGGRIFVAPESKFGQIELNNSDLMATKGYIDSVFQKSYDLKWSSTPNVPLHELGHLIAYYVDSFAHQQKTVMSKNRKNIAVKVSGYATTKYREFCAETIAGMLYGIKYDNDVIDMLPLADDDRDGAPFNRLKENARKTSESLGAYIPREIFDTLNGTNLVTPQNFDNYDYTSEQKANAAFADFATVCTMKEHYNERHTGIAHVAIDNFCKIMNGTFDFELPTNNDDTKRKRAMALMLKMKMAKAKI